MRTPHIGPVATRSARRTLVVLLLVYAVSYMDRQLVAILIDPIKRELGISDTAAGLLYGFAFAVFFSFLGIPIARLADRSNRSRIITASLVLFSAMTTLSAWAATYWQLMLARMTVGIGEAGTSPPSHSIISDLYPVERRGTAMAIFASGLHIGVLLGFLIGGALGQLFGWRTAFFLAGLTGLALSVFSAWLVKEPVRTQTLETHAKSGGIREVAGLMWQNRSMRHLVIGGTIMNVGTSALMAWLPALLVRSHGLSLARTGLLLAFVLGVLGAGGTMLGGILADRLGARSPAWRLRCIVVVFLASVPCWTVAIMAGNSVIALTAFMLGGAFIAFHVGPSFAMVQALSPVGMRASAASIVIFLTNLVGVGVGPLLIGVLSDAGLGKYGADSLRPALLVVPVILVWAAFHYEVASRRLADELRALPADETSRTTVLDAKVAPAT